MTPPHPPLAAKIRRTFTALARGNVLAATVNNCADRHCLLLVLCAGMHREAAGLATLRATTPHMIFKGNPGTGKTVRAVHGRQA